MAVQNSFLMFKEHAYNKKQDTRSHKQISCTIFIHLTSLKTLPVWQAAARCPHNPSRSLWWYIGHGYVTSPDAEHSPQSPSSCSPAPPLCRLRLHQPHQSGSIICKWQRNHLHVHILHRLRTANRVFSLLLFMIFLNTSVDCVSFYCIITALFQLHYRPSRFSI